MSKEALKACLLSKETRYFICENRETKTVEEALVKMDLGEHPAFTHRNKKSMTLLLSTQNLLLFHVELLMKYLWNEDDRAVIPSHCIKKPSTVDVAPKARGCKINQEHNEFLVNLVHKNACTTVSMLCYKIIAEWKAASVDFHKNYVFIDEADSTHIKSVELVEPLKSTDAAKIEKEFPHPKSKKRKAETNQPAKITVKKVGSGTQSRFGINASTKKPVPFDIPTELPLSLYSASKAN
ncbi:hypothetical protein RO3G_05406 [Rhizopus delemar RA 99-880]|uniref:Uncharacterized protein n=1 Tax=Rhizopus delemar (strain RA 99-880 / ATCC MYA-4621 / FGSC 9543 / NRRL 43880) TaxID=246409 RepID=I1BWX1_RHIO9|nr:hypothetical protein RO3G_05406 [Rhizopus delemar RA 99-880]|eukprot:EIE80701.1 hypothetical protein RO3G_05406 [Rhizopus delemar RA 99-880]